MKVTIYDKEDNIYFIDDDGEKLVFENNIDAKNYLFSLGYKYSFVQEMVVFVPYNKSDIR